MTTTNGDPVAYYRVEACQWNGSGWDVVRAGYTDDDGLYAIAGLAAGTYRIWFADESETYLPEAYDDAADLDAGTDVAVAVGGSATDVDAALARRPPVPPAMLFCQSASADSAEIRFAGTVGPSYVAQQTSALTNDWNDVGDEMYCEDGTNSCVVPIVASQTFLRIRMIP